MTKLQGYATHKSLSNSSSEAGSLDRLVVNDMTYMSFSPSQQLTPTNVLQERHMSPTVGSMSGQSVVAANPATQLPHLETSEWDITCHVDALHVLTWVMGQGTSGRETER